MMDMVATMSSAVGSIKLVAEIVKSVREISGDAKVNPKLIEIQDVVLSLQGDILRQRRGSLRFTR